MLAGEPSGDRLGAGLITGLRFHYPQAHFEGIGGEHMMAAGLQSLYPLEKLTIMGLTEVLRHLPDLIRMRRALFKHLIKNPPSIFIGIDAPDFNLPLERRLRARGIPVVHYVSPQLWAWRPGRARHIARHIDLMLTLLPFEADFYKAHSVPVQYVGHPLADEIPLHSDSHQTRQQLHGVSLEHPLVALLPGSRISEAQRLGPLFFSVAHRLQGQQPNLQFIVPTATPAIHRLLSVWLRQHLPELPIILIQGHARDVITAANVVLVASGTATLETLLIKRPMVVAYKVAPVTGFILSRLISVPQVALPNLLAQKRLVPEYIQGAATLENISAAVWQLLNDNSAQKQLIEEFTTLHKVLRRGANKRAAAAIADLLGSA
jgi:lipid-A-disaccharide synthase